MCVKEHFKQHRLFYCCLLFVTLYGLFCCASKCIFEVDESLSYSLSNEIGGWISYPVKNQVFDQSFWKGYAVIDNPFSYWNVYRNQAWDCHPPLYYAILHTICSFTRNICSVWQGLSINIVSYIINCCLIYIILHSATKKKYMSLMGMLLYATNQQIISGLLFIRMYQLASTFVLVFLLSGYAICTSTSRKTIWYFILFCDVIAGGLTHYYFYYSVLCLAIVFALRLIKNRKFKELILSFLLVLSGTLLNLYVVFPPSLSHLTESTHANYATSHFSPLNFSLETLFIYIRGSWCGVWIVCIISAFIAYLLLKKNPGNKPSLLVYCLFASAFYLISVSKISDIQSARYLLPMECVGIIGTICLIGELTNDSVIQYCILSILIISKFSFPYSSFITKKSWQIARENKDSTCYVITDGTLHYYEINTLFLDLREYESTTLTTDKTFPLDSHNESTYIIYLQKEIDTNIDELTNRYSFSYINKLSTPTAYFDMFILQK